MMNDLINNTSWGFLEWKPLDCFNIITNKYLISSQGEIWNIDKGCYIKPFVINSGYKVVRLKTIHGLEKRFLVHRLVAFMFCNPPSNISSLQVNHINGVKTMNYDCNLEWVTRSDNMRHALEIGLSSCRNETHYKTNLTNEQVTLICSYLEQGMHYKDILNLLGLPVTNNNCDTIGNIRRGITWKNISNNYDFSNHTGRKFTTSQIEQICQMLKDGFSRQSIYYNITGFEWRSATKSEKKNFGEFIRKLLSGRSHQFDYITSKCNLSSSTTILKET